MDSIVATLFVIYAALAAAVLAGSTAFWLRLTGIAKEQGVLEGRLEGIQGQLEQVNGNIARLEGEIGRLDGKTDSRIDRLDSRIDRLENKVDVLREEMQRSNDLLREEMRRNTDRIIQVVISHSHQDGGPPVFNVPPESETVAADN